jgi:hypothetical protein
MASDLSMHKNENEMSCCGTICNECENYPHYCRGCSSIKGKVYWLEFTEEKICPVYNCCITKKKLYHCGQCGLLPCSKFKRKDPTKSIEENKEILEKQLAKLNNHH